MDKILLILADGMRPESLSACGNPYVDEVLSHSHFTLNGKTVMPSVTLPCHMSLFHSVTPDRHGILTNVYVPQVRPVKGLVETLHDQKKTAAFYFNWAELRDLSRPGYLSESFFASGHTYGYEKANKMLVDAAIPYLKENKPDFTFLYFGSPDAAGHNSGWMGEEYLHAVSGCFDEMKRIITALGEDWLVIITADHGGHGRGHGADIPEDMTIPIIAYHPSFKKRELDNANIIDIAPTVTSFLGVEPDNEWEGKPLPILD